MQLMLHGVFFAHVFVELFESAVSMLGANQPWSLLLIVFIFSEILIKAYYLLHLN